QMTALVRETIGFNQGRGDSVNLVNVAFNSVKPPEEAPVAWWKQVENHELARSLAWPVGMVMLGLLVVLGMVRPGLKLMRSPAAKTRKVQPLNALVDETPERPGLPMPSPQEITAEQTRMSDAKRLALENPVAVANIVKGWVNGESPA